MASQFDISESVFPHPILEMRFLYQSRDAVMEDEGYLGDYGLPKEFSRLSMKRQQAFALDAVVKLLAHAQREVSE